VTVDLVGWQAARGDAKRFAAVAHRSSVQQGTRSLQALMLTMNE
jgi:hypothetical protein